MKKPKIKKGNRALILAVLWLLIENPTNLETFRNTDIKELLESEFNKHVDCKTASNYLKEIKGLYPDLILEHLTNKGSYIKKNKTISIEKQVIINAIKEEKNLDDKTLMAINEMINFFSSAKERQECYMLLKNNEVIDKMYSLNNILDDLNKAIKNKNKIRFGYETFYYKSGLKKRCLIYEAIPVEIKYLDGMYYLITLEPLWPNIYCGIKIRYMRNLEILEEVNEVIPENLNYKIDLGINYDWAIEFIDETFNNYKISNANNMLVAHIEAPYEQIVNFCKRYNPFYTVNDEKILSRMENDAYEILNSVKNNKDIINIIKRGIVNFYYFYDLDKANDYKLYMKYLKRFIENIFLDLKYKKITDDILTLNDNKVAFDIVTYNSDLINEQGDINRIKEAKTKLLNKDANNRYIILLYDYLSNTEKENILKIVNSNSINNTHDRFSVFTTAYYHNFDVFEI